jgi:hypothetical protein
MRAAGRGRKQVGFAEAHTWGEGCERGRVQGFRTARAKSIVVQINQQARLDFSLQVGEVQETVEVTATAPRYLARRGHGEAGEAARSRERRAGAQNSRFGRGVRPLSSMPTTRTPLAGPPTPLACREAGTSPARSTRDPAAPARGSLIPPPLAPAPDERESRRGIWLALLAWTRRPRRGRRSRALAEKGPRRRATA